MSRIAERDRHGAPLAGLALVGCQTSSSDVHFGRSKVTGEITVFAAASLTESFTAAGQGLRGRQPRHEGHVQLRRQLGARAADQPGRTRRRVRLGRAGEHEAGDRRRHDHRGARRRSSKNKLAIAVPKGNPGEISRACRTSRRPDKKIALCAEQVPCGAAAKKVFEVAKVTPAPDTLEQDVKAVLTKVSLGEVDARAGLPDGREGRRRQGRGHRVRRVRPGRQRLPDRLAGEGAERGRRQGVRRLRAVRQGPYGARPRRVSSARDAATGDEDGFRSSSSCPPCSAWRSCWCRWPGC